MSDIWEKKVRTHFRRKDLDKDGVISRKHFVGMAERFAGLEKFDEKQKKAAMKSFDKLFSRYTRKSHHKDVLTEDWLVQSLKDQKDDPGFKKDLSDLIFSLLSPLDVNKDGHLDANEYRRIFENVGIVESDFTKAAFEAIDTDHDGSLSFEEFSKALHDYMCSDAENTTAVFGIMV